MLLLPVIQQLNLLLLLLISITNKFIIMAYTGLSISTAVKSATLSSHCIPAYPQFDDSTTYNAAFYTDRQSSNQDLAGSTVITLVVV